MVSVEQLYKKFAILADAKDKAGEVRICIEENKCSPRFIPSVKLSGWGNFTCFILLLMLLHSFSLVSP